MSFAELFGMTILKGRGVTIESYVTDIFKRSLATKLIGFSLGQAYMADHYKSLSHSGDGSKPFFPDPLGSCRL